MTSWLNPARWLLAAGLVAALLAGYGAWSQHQQNIGRQEVRAEWMAEKAAASEAARQREKALQAAAEKIDHDYQVEKKRRAAADRITAGRLREYQAASSAASAEANAPSGVDGAYRAVADGCARALAGLDGYAQRVAGQARALQDYVREVSHD